MNTKPLLIFVAGPFSSPSAVVRERNVHEVHGVIKELMKKGHYVLECHSLEHAFFPDDELEHAEFLRQTLRWLDFCDALYLVDNSPGANLELSKAQRLGLRIYTRLDEVPNIIEFQDTIDDINNKLFEELKR